MKDEGRRGRDLFLAYPGVIDVIIGHWSFVIRHSSVPLLTQIRRLGPRILANQQCRRGVALALFHAPKFEPSGSQLIDFGENREPRTENLGFFRWFLGS